MLDYLFSLLSKPSPSDDEGNQPGQVLLPASLQEVAFMVSDGKIALWAASSAETKHDPLLDALG